MDPQIITLITIGVGAVLPALTAAVTHRRAAPAVKAVVLLALSAVAGTVTQLAAGDRFVAKTIALRFATTFAAAVAAHFGVLKPAGVTGSDGAIAAALPGGAGSPQSDQQPAQ